MIYESCVWPLWSQSKNIVYCFSFSIKKLVLFPNVKVMDECPFSFLGLASGFPEQLVGQLCHCSADIVLCQTKIYFHVTWGQFLSVFCFYSNHNLSPTWQCGVLVLYKMAFLQFGKVWPHIIVNVLEWESKHFLFVLSKVNRGPCWRDYFKFAEGYFMLFESKVSQAYSRDLKLFIYLNFCLLVK